jgi:hypothetical protein
MHYSCGIYFLVNIVVHTDVMRPGKSITGGRLGINGYD